MHSFGLQNSFRTLVLLAPALTLAACVYRPVVIEGYDEVSSYEELNATVRDNGELQSAIDKNLMRVMRPGEQVPGWTESGVDAEEALSTAPGGVEDNIFLLERADEVALTSKRSLNNLFGPQYSTYPVLGDESMFEAVRDDQSFAAYRIGEGVWLETLARGEEMGTASCSSLSAEGALLHAKRPFTDLSKLEKSMLAALIAAAGRDDPTVCTLTEPDGEARWRVRYFLPDGRRLPAFDSEGYHVTIIPRAEAMRFIEEPY